MLLKGLCLHLCATSTQHCAWNIEEAQEKFQNGLEALDLSFPDLPGYLKPQDTLGSLYDVFLPLSWRFITFHVRQMGRTVRRCSVY